jgi:hypothetical protein
VTELTLSSGRSELSLPCTPCEFDAEFLADLPYDPDVLLLDRIEEIVPDAHRVRCRMPTDRPIPFMDRQRVHDQRHPRHVAGAALVHATGMLGFVHAYYVLGLRHAQGWIGYGTHIHKAVFRKLVPPGSPIDCTCIAEKLRLGRTRHIVRYRFEFLHEGERCYEGEQSAVWMQVDTKAPPETLD